MLLTTKKSLRNLVATVFIACLALPGIASATLLNLTNTNPLFAADFASGSIFNDLVGDVDVTITASNATITTSAVGLGVFGGADGKLNNGEWIEFGFDPQAYIQKAVLNADVTNWVGYTIDSSGANLMQIFGGNSDISIVATANTLRFTDVSAGGLGLTPGYTIGYLDIKEVPEPAVLGLLGFGLLGIGVMRRSKKTA